LPRPSGAEPRFHIRVRDMNGTVSGMPFWVATLIAEDASKNETIRGLCVRLAKTGLTGIVVLGVAGLVSAPTTARGQLQWQLPRMEPLRLRLVAVAWNHPRTSFFANEEVFIAEKEITKEEARLVKLVYEFLPYQPRLSDNRFDYSTVHELRAARDPGCDETLEQITTGQSGDWRQERSHLKYAHGAPALNLARHKSRLPCYVTNAEDYSRPVHEPASEE